MNERDIQILDAQLQMDMGRPATKTGGSMQKLVEVKTLVNGRDIASVSEEELVQMIKALEKEQNDLEQVRTESAAINARKADINNALRTLATQLDRKYAERNPAPVAAPAA